MSDFDNSKKCTSEVVHFKSNQYTIKFLSLGTDSFERTSADPDQTAPKEQSDQGLHCLLFNLNLLDLLLHIKI